MTGSRSPNSIWNFAAPENSLVRARQASRVFAWRISFATRSCWNWPSAKQPWCSPDRTPKSPPRRLAALWCRCGRAGNTRTAWLRSARTRGFRETGGWGSAVTREDILLLFEYDRWANHRVIRSVAKLSPEQFTRNLGGSFPSVRSTLIHTIGGEWIWLQYWKAKSLDTKFVADLQKRRDLLF